MEQESTQKNYRYLDGSGNEYIINNEFIEYIPIKPIYSSSGIYDGGNYTKKEINKLEYDQLISILNRAMNNEKSHIKNRVKASGVVAIKDKKKEKTCILSPDSTEVQNIEKILHEIISNC